MNPNNNPNPNPNRNPKLSQRLAGQAVGISRVQSSVAGQSTALEFNTPEELLRHDAAKTDVPDRVAERLKESIRKEPRRPQAWWKRLFGG